MPKVSVIIPCYNQGSFLTECVHSVVRQTYDDFEIIIVNDGSSDAETVRVLSVFQADGRITIVHTDNQGLASARNNGIRIAQGEYILPLDADDRIKPEYLRLAVDNLDKDPDLGIVYCRAQLFGAVDTEWLLPEYSIEQMLLDNIIFCAAMYRRRDWERVGGYDTGMVYGWEDYDLWLSLIEVGRGVLKIPEILFDYRVAPDSMVRSKERWQKVEMFKRIYNRHKELFSEHINVWIESILETGGQYYTSRLYIDCGAGVSDDRSIALKVDKGTSSVHFKIDGYTNIQSIRFDPIDTPAVVELRKCIFFLSDGIQKEITEVTDNSIFAEGKDRYFETNDPQCFFDLDGIKLESLKSVTIQLSFKALGMDALDAIIIKLRGQKTAGHGPSGNLKNLARKFRSLTR
ncbi:glycosyltransferase family A protein [Desulfopila sp. IMCC35008]|uniref:glycosyltransferase family 2 protein n=1 Tax=Desulfopila sp. IMCC35008 TaxID=2653858 RepID=UPI0013D38E4C|nr:glycosyltransferase family A protein [Desulfopila sp. IMCC35008]